ncbi:TetR/AcrR family transcriptional regulator [Demequina pelophila]|uniref:TetR/AcrR family transcriptional regulator n=1 Tax=Demequina pelophila TaxID=1638984 RepID=UPI000785C2A2|nr:TetR family transcriptional regulator [Demequina pelophila]
MSTKRNRGPGAAAENREALLAAAREAFSEHGAGVPLSTIARNAGVGQAVLYRHFPTREMLAHAVFDQNMARIEALAATPDADIREVADLITHQIEGMAAVISLFAADEDSPHQRELVTRMRTALDPVLARAREAGQVRTDATIDELLTAIGMVAALVMRSPAAHRHDRAEQAWRLIASGLGPR